MSRIGKMRTMGRTRIRMIVMMDQMVKIVHVGEAGQSTDDVTVKVLISIYM